MYLLTWNLLHLIKAFSKVLWMNRLSGNFSTNCPHHFQRFLSTLMLIFSKVQMEPIIVLIVSNNWCTCICVCKMNCMFNQLLSFSGAESCGIAHLKLCLLHCVRWSKVEIQTNSLLCKYTLRAFPLSLNACVSRLLNIFDPVQHEKWSNDQGGTCH